MTRFFTRKLLITASQLKDKPVKFQGAISDWPALGKWTNAYLMDRLQNSESKAPNLFAFDKNNERNRLSNHTVKTGFEQVLYGDTSQKFYLTRQPLRHQEARLLDDILVPSWIKNKRFYQPNFWAGQNMSSTPLHYDSTDGYLCQIAGYKRVYLFSPEDSLYLYPRSPLTKGRFNFGEITDIHHASVDTYPQFLHANLRSILLKPGDSLYIPQGWWHQVFNLSHSVAVNFFFTNHPKGYSPKQEILMYQACKNFEKAPINDIINRGSYESCLESALSLLEFNALDYASYFALTYFEEYLKAHFLRHFFSEFALKPEAIASELRHLAIGLFNSRQTDSEKYYQNLEQANDHLKTKDAWSIPDSVIKKWMALSLKMLQGNSANIKAEDIRLLVADIKSVCVSAKDKDEQTQMSPSPK